MDMLAIDKMSRVPIYEQIINGIEKEILSGLLKPLDQLPSVRELALTLSANPNTVQKAFTELDRKGVTVSLPGKGSFVSANAPDILKLNLRARLSEIETFVHQLYSGGVSKEEILEAVNKGLNHY